MDYKELIELLECPYSSCDCKKINGIPFFDCEECRYDTDLKAAEAIKNLVAELDAAIEELRGICWCCAHGKKLEKAPEWSKIITCEHMSEFGALACSGKNVKCQHWQWRGPKTDKAGEPDG